MSAAPRRKHIPKVWKVYDVDPLAQALAVKHHKDTGQNIGDIVSHALVAYLTPQNK